MPLAGRRRRRSARAGAVAPRTQPQCAPRAARAVTRPDPLAHRRPMATATTRHAPAARAAHRMLHVAHSSPLRSPSASHASCLLRRTPSPPLIDIPSHIIADRNTSQRHSVLKTRVPRKQQAHDHQTHIAATSEGDPRQWVQPRVSGHDESKLLCRARPSARPARRGLRLHLFCGRRFHFLATTRSSVGASSGHQRSKPCRLGGVIDIFTATSGGR